MLLAFENGADERLPSRMPTMIRCSLVIPSPLMKRRGLYTDHTRYRIVAHPSSPRQGVNPAVRKLAGAAADLSVLTALASRASSAGRAASFFLAVEQWYVRRHVRVRSISSFRFNFYSTRYHGAVMGSASETSICKFATARTIVAISC